MVAREWTDDEDRSIDPVHDASCGRTERPSNAPILVGADDHDIGIVAAGKVADMFARMSDLDRDAIAKLARNVLLEASQFLLSALNEVLHPVRDRRREDVWRRNRRRNDHDVREEYSTTHCSSELDGILDDAR